MTELCPDLTSLSSRDVAVTCWSDTLYKTDDNGGGSVCVEVLAVGLSRKFFPLHTRLALLQRQAVREDWNEKGHSSFLHL